MATKVKDRLNTLKKNKREQELSSGGPSHERPDYFYEIEAVGMELDAEERQARYRYIIGLALGAAMLELA